MSSSFGTGIVQVNVSAQTTSANTFTNVDYDIGFVEKGFDGVDGACGVKGEKGACGILGPCGLKGGKGDLGPCGLHGSVGNFGPCGVKGEKGDDGACGIKGAKGDDGSCGIKGAKGNDGACGIKGAKGDDGACGIKGAKGDDGACGVKGQKGSCGILGPCGLKGGKGDDGSCGIKGDKGDGGACGIKGAKGDDGSCGIKGAKGDDGACGIKGSKGDDGACGIKGSKGDDGACGIKGSKGDDGACGIKGAKGDAGPCGLKGGKGDDGACGILGPCGLHGSVGNFGPCGIKGDKGDGGACGVKGEKGSCGPIGPSTGLRLEYDTSGTTSPTSGKFSSNSTNPSLITQFYFNPDNTSTGYGYNWITSWLDNAGGSVTVDPGNSQTNPDRSSFEVVSVVGSPGTGIISVQVSVQVASATALQNLAGGYNIDFIEKGFDGACGVKGEKGSCGILGPCGLKGGKGDDGSCGIKGDKGDGGACGIKGAKGDDGSCGIKGSKGDDGACGIKGSKGDDGACGIKGSKGDDGACGIKGSKGDDGACGIKGGKGDDGACGIKGAKGDDGACGIKGGKGDDGACGVKGDAGACGVKGEKGSCGILGPCGLKGGKGDDGSCGIKGDKGDGGACGIKGAKGDDGSCGIKGAKGNDGACGVKGQDGGKGACGLRGEKATKTFTYYLNSTTNTGSLTPGALGAYTLLNSAGAGLEAGDDWADVAKILIFNKDKNNSAVVIGNLGTSSQIYFETVGGEPGTGTPSYVTLRIGTSTAVGNYFECTISGILSSSTAGTIPNNNVDVTFLTNAENKGILGPTGPACFTANTLIKTPNGEKRIEDIKDGDCVISPTWDSEGNISYSEGIVYGKVSHDKNKDLLKITYESGYVECTPEHWIFSPDGTFKEAEKFKVGDLVVVNPTQITPITSIKSIPPQKTYNFEVNDQRSYIANNLLVHNMGLGKVTAFQYTPLKTGDRIRYNETNSRFETYHERVPFVWTMTGQQYGGDNAVDIMYFLGQSSAGVGGTAISYSGSITISDETTWERCIYTLPFSATFVGYSVTYTDTTDDIDGDSTLRIMSLVPSANKGSVVQQHTDLTSSWSFRDTTSPPGPGNTTPAAIMGNWMQKDFLNLTNYWPTLDTGNEQFAAGTRVMVHSDRTSGTVPAHTINLVGYYNPCTYWNDSHNSGDTPT